MALEDNRRRIQQWKVELTDLTDRIELPVNACADDCMVFINGMLHISPQDFSIEGNSLIFTRNWSRGDQMVVAYFALDDLPERQVAYMGSIEDGVI